MTEKKDAKQVCHEWDSKGRMYAMTDAARAREPVSVYTNARGLDYIVNNNSFIRMTYLINYDVSFH